MSASKPDTTAAESPAHETPRFMNVRQVARYLQINDKKVYALVNEGRIPGDAADRQVACSRATSSTSGCSSRATVACSPTASSSPAATTRCCIAR